MRKTNPYKYHLGRFTFGIFTVEIIFWLIVWQLLAIFGYFSSSPFNEKLLFISPKSAWGFLLISLLIVIYILYIKWRNKVVRSFKNENTYATFLQPVSTQRLFVRYTLLRTGIAFLIFALMQPALGVQKVKGTTNGAELIFAVDISNSMNTQDTKTKESRLTVAKRVMNQLINKANIGQVGLVVFAGDAYTQLPLTANKNAVKLYVNELSTDYISNQGTNIASAFKNANQLFTSRNNKKILVLITDGEDHGGQLKNSIASLKEKNVNFLLLGIGSEKGGLVPAPSNQNQRWMRDQDGKVVVSKINRKMLRNIVQLTNGLILISDSPFPNISKFLTEINSNSTGNLVHLKFKVKKNRYQWPLGLGLLCFIVLFSIGGWPQKRIHSE